MSHSILLRERSIVVMVFSSILFLGASIASADTEAITAVSSATFTIEAPAPDLGTITLIPIDGGPLAYGKFVFGGDVSVGANGGQVLGTSTSAGGSDGMGAFATSTDDTLPAGCTAYLDSFLKKGLSAGEPVKKLQKFLNDELHVDLPTNGLFSDLTFEAVKLFQLKHNDDILKPWVPFGLAPNTPTGYVYKTTAHYINMAMCKNLNEPVPVLP